MNTLPLRFEDDTLILLDQRELPTQIVRIECRTVEQVAEAIETLAVRGAPAIGVAAAFGVALGISTTSTTRRALEDSRRAVARLRRTRPTAVNLFWALDRVQRKAELAADSGQDVRSAVIDEASVIVSEDIASSDRMAVFGSDLLDGEQVLMTYCNAGALATAGGGTALAVVCAIHARGDARLVVVPETRPLWQGARLTAWELAQRGIPYVIITDGAAVFAMKHFGVTAVLVGADRIAVNGDVANKIGTYSIALAARSQNVPFYVVAPRATFDPEIGSGESIAIEERHASEVVEVCGRPIAPPDATVFNPAFDVTPAEFVTAFITEAGVITPPFEAALTTLWE